MSELESDKGEECKRAERMIHAFNEGTAAVTTAGLMALSDQLYPHRDKCLYALDKQCAGKRMGGLEIAVMMDLGL